MSTGPDLTVDVEPVEYEEEAEQFLAELPYKWPPCCSGYKP